MVCYLQGRTQGVGVKKKPLSYIFYKNFITCAMEKLFSHTFCLLICRLNANFKEHVNGPKSNN